jgi:hypothetical protein
MLEPQESWEKQEQLVNLLHPDSDEKTDSRLSCSSPPLLRAPNPWKSSKVKQAVWVQGVDSKPEVLLNLTV